MHRLVRLLLPLTVLVLIVPPSQAQTSSTLALNQVTLQGPQAWPYEPGNTTIEAPWMFAYTNPVGGPAATATQETVEIHWSISCEGPAATPVTAILAGSTVTEIQLEPTTSQYTGTAVLQPALTRESAPPAGQPLQCMLTGTTNQGEDDEAVASAVLVAPVGYDGPVTLAVADDAKTAKPQKQMAYMVDVRNDGTTPVRVTWELPDRSEDGLRDWTPLVPDAVVVGPKSTVTVPFVVSTPFENGVNKDSTELTLRAIPHPADNPEAAGQPVEVVLDAKVDGFYVPGPSPLLVLAVLAGLALLRRR